VQETVGWLQRERGLSAADAYSLASIGVNFTVAEAVDDVQMVYAAVPKKLFATKPPFWSR
jgi:acetamidase/formamidase